MKILVFSDSHGAEENFISAIRENPSAEAIIFLGDGERDFEYALAYFGIFPYGNEIKDVYHVRGNCDFHSSASDSVIAEVKNTRLFITHGYEQKVKIILWDPVIFSAAVFCFWQSLERKRK